MKLAVPHSVVGFDAFADFYRYPANRTDRASLILWIGGAIPLDKYESRRTLDLVERPGDHSFADYAANSSVSEAFEFVLERLRDC